MCGKTSVWKRAQCGQVIEAYSIDRDRRVGVAERHVLDRARNGELLRAGVAPSWARPAGVARAGTAARAAMRLRRDSMTILLVRDSAASRPALTSAVCGSRRIENMATVAPCASARPHAPVTGAPRQDLAAEPLERAAQPVVADAAERLRRRRGGRASSVAGRGGRRGGGRRHRAPGGCAACRCSASRTWR